MEVVSRFAEQKGHHNKEASSSSSSSSCSDTVSDQQLCSIHHVSSKPHGMSSVAFQCQSVEVVKRQPLLPADDEALDTAVRVSTAAELRASPTSRQSSTQLGQDGSDDDAYSSTNTDGDAAVVEVHDEVTKLAAKQLAGTAGEGHSHLDLMRTSILVWLALALHNIPEGLATVVG